MKYVRANGAKSAKSVSAKLDKASTCLREAAMAKAGNAAGLSAVAFAKADRLFQQSRNLSHESKD